MWMELRPFTLFSSLLFPSPIGIGVELYSTKGPTNEKGHPQNSREFFFFIKIRRLRMVVSFGGKKELNGKKKWILGDSY